MGCCFSSAGGGRNLDAYRIHGDDPGAESSGRAPAASGTSERTRLTMPASFGSADVAVDSGAAPRRKMPASFGSADVAAGAGAAPRRKIPASFGSADVAAGAGAAPRKMPASFGSADVAAAPGAGGSTNAFGSQNVSSANIQQGNFSWDRKARPDPKDFMAKGLRGGVFLREPGSIGGQSFVVDDCQDCTILLLDQIAQITVDECVNCRIVCGPVESSMFIRDSKNCVGAVACRQFRTRDLKNCDLALHCHSRPVIEESTGLRLGCWDLDYNGLSAHLSAALMTPFANHWSYVHDFTPRPGNWTFLPEGMSTLEMLTTSDRLALEEGKEALPELACLSGDVERTCVKTRGERDLPAGEVGFVLLPPGMESAARQVLTTMLAKGHQLQRTNAAKLPAGDVQDVVLMQLNVKANAKVKGALSKGKSVGLEFIGVGAEGDAVAAAAAVGGFGGGNGGAAEFRYLGIEG